MDCPTNGYSGNATRMDEKMTPNETIASLLEQSVRQYNKILSFMEELNAILENGQPALVNESLRQLDQLQVAAVSIDRELLNLLKQDNAASVMTERLQVRQEVIDHCLAKNDELRKKLEGRMAVMSQEIVQARHARGAMAGYGKSANQQQAMLQRHC